MDAKELRVGNTVSCFGTNGGPNEWVELNISPQHIQTCFDRPEWFKGILITEEWLLRLGFFKYNDSEYYINDNDRLTELYRLFKHNGYFAVSHHVIELKYIHQLQNFHYAVKGEELTIKDI